MRDNLFAIAVHLFLTLCWKVKRECKLADWKASSWWQDNWRLPSAFEELSSSYSRSHSHFGSNFESKSDSDLQKTLPLSESRPHCQSNQEPDLWRAFAARLRMWNRPICKCLRSGGHSEFTWKRRPNRGCWTKWADGRIALLQINKINTTTTTTMADWRPRATWGTHAVSSNLLLLFFFFFFTFFAPRK